MIRTPPAANPRPWRVLILWRTCQHSAPNALCQHASVPRSQRRFALKTHTGRHRRQRRDVAAPFAALPNPATQEADAGTDAQYMRRALELARRGLGKTYPNPAVGCVIVRGGEVVGEGYHPKAGEPHAEVFALRAAGQKAEGATAYVTLEPCNHYGRTPPCALALVEARVARVVVGVVDPNPLVGGQGIKTLEAAGVAVSSGVEEDASYAINEEFMQRMAAQAAEFN